MKFLDDLYDMYKHHLTGDEEDAFVIISGVLQDLSDHDIDIMIRDLTEDERFDMFALYLFERFQIKVAEEGIGQTNNMDDPPLKYFH